MTLNAEQNDRLLLLMSYVVDKPTGKRPLGRSRYRWEVNIRMDLKEIGVNMRNNVKKKGRVRHLPDSSL